MKRFGSVLSKVILMLLLAEVIVFSFSGCSGESKKNSEGDNKTPVQTSSQTGEDNGNLTGNDTNSPISNQTSSPATIAPDNEAGAEQNNEPGNGGSTDPIKDVDTESALKLASGLLLGIAEANIIPSEQPTVVFAKPGEKSCMVGTCDILKKVLMDEVPAINVIESENAAWRITFTYKPEITVEAVDDVDNPQKVIKLYPEEDL
ncbi:MAG: hypothetical protein BWY74_02585 [Firmicutes bacterium ADurb.Bin419]|nr:MAG: hypothetical protein BWY74_02585 [Firmicutes bacterium ADurb.Bin419]